MTTEECYEKIGGNYAETYGRFGDDVLIKRFAIKFISDKSFQSLEESMAKNDTQAKFQAAHTFKGVCANLGFDALFSLSSKITEIFRAGKTEGSEELFSKIKEQYKITIENLNELARN